MLQEKTDIILTESAAIVSAETLLRTPVKELSSTDTIVAWSVLDLMEKELMKKRLGDLRAGLFTLAVKNGKKNEKGSYVWEAKAVGAKVTKQHKKGKARVIFDKLVGAFSEKPHVMDAVILRSIRLREGKYQKLAGILRYLSNSIDRSEGGQSVEISTGIIRDLLSVTIDWNEDMSTTVDEKALEGLVQAGMVSLAELKEVTEVGDPTWALVVKKPDAVQKLLERSKEHGRGDPGKTG